MTAFGLVASLAWTAFAVLLLFQAKPFVQRWLDAQLRAIEPAAEIPPDLLGLATNETEEWAQAQTLKVIREKYEEYGKDWNKVRAAVGVARVA